MLCSTLAYQNNMRKWIPMQCMLTVRGNRKASDVSEINAHLIKKSNRLF